MSEDEMMAVSGQVRFNEELHKHYTDILALGGAGCNLCARCTYPDAPCRFPEKRMFRHGGLRPHRPLTHLKHERKTARRPRGLRLIIRGVENVDSFQTAAYGNPEADILLIQMVDDHDLAVIENEVTYIGELSGGQDFCLKAVKVNSWNRDLSPWPAPPVFGNEDFGDGAADTLKYLLESVIPGPEETDCRRAGRIFIGGYSLAGLFALWAGYQTERFDGIAAASPSIWFPHFTEYMQENEIRAEKIYLSLGDREEKTRNPVMAQVGSAIRKAHDLLCGSGKDCVLEWNKGNHFKDPDLRTARAFAWLMNTNALIRA